MSTATTEGVKQFRPASFAGLRKSSGVTLQIIPFRARHVPLINPSVSAEMMELAELAESHGHAWTACILGDPVASAGMVLQVGGSAEVWTILSPLVKCYPLQLCKQIKAHLEMTIAELKPTRVYAVIDPNSETAKRFVELFGFRMSKHIYDIETGGSR